MFLRLVVARLLVMHLRRLLIPKKPLTSTSGLVMTTRMI